MIILKRIALLFSLLLTLILVACGGDGNNENSNEPTNSDGEVVVEFWHAMSGPHEEVLNNLVDDFNQEHDHITVNPVNQGSYDDLEQKVMASARAKTLPTVSQAVPQMIPEYLDNDFLTPLDEFIEDEEIGLSEEDLEDFIEIFKESSTWDDKFYSMPFSKSTTVLFYNTEILEEHGFDVPETWEDIREISEEVSGDGLVGMGFENSFEAVFQSILLQLGGTYIDEETAEAKFNSPEGIEALSFMNDMIDEGIARLAGEDDYMSEPFSRGDVAMYIGTSPGIAHVAEAAEGNIEWMTTSLPKTDGKGATPFQGNDLVIFDDAEQAEKEAAWLFLKYLTSPEVTAEWAMHTGYLPTRYSALELEEFEQYLSENPEFQSSVDQFDDGFVIARIKGGNAARNIILEELEEVFLDRQTVEEALQAAEERSNEVLEK